MQEFQNFRRSKNINTFKREIGFSLPFQEDRIRYFSGDVIEITRAAVLSDALIAFTSHDTTGSRRGGLSFCLDYAKKKFGNYRSKNGCPVLCKKKGKVWKKREESCGINFYQIQKQRAYHKIATAHHLDDHLETFFSVYYEEALWRDWRGFPENRQIKSDLFEILKRRKFYPIWSDIKLHIVRTKQMRKRNIRGIEFVWSFFLN